MQFDILPYLFCQLLSLLIAIFCYKRLRMFSLQAFIPLLLITCSIEILASCNEMFGWKSNYFLYNWYLLLSPPFYLYLFYKMLDLQGTAGFVFAVIALLAVLLVFLNYFFVQGNSIFNNYSFLFIEIINIVFCCIILFKMALIDEPGPEPLFQLPYFWISLSLLLFSLGAVVVLGMQEYIAKNKIEIEGKPLYRFIMPALNMVLYLGYSYAFLLCRKKNNNS